DAYQELGETQKALDVYAQSLALVEATGDREGRATLFNNVAILHMGLGEQAEALPSLREAARLFGQRHSPDEPMGLANLGPVLRRVGRVEEDLQVCLKAAALLQQRANRWAETSVLRELGLARSVLGQRGAARKDLHKALELKRALGDRAGEGRVLRDLAS